MDALYGPGERLAVRITTVMATTVPALVYFNSESASHPDLIVSKKINKVGFLFINCGMQQCGSFQQNRCINSLSN